MSVVRDEETCSLGHVHSKNERFRCDSCSKESVSPMPVELVIVSIEGGMEMRCLHACSASCAPGLMRSAMMAITRLGDCEVEMSVRGDSALELLMGLSARATDCEA